METELSKGNGVFFADKKLFHYRLQDLEAPRISRQSAPEGGKVVSPTYRPPLPPREDPGYSFLLEDGSTSGP